jgi:hypothetical protein
MGRTNTGEPLALSLSKGGLPRADPGFDRLSPSGEGILGFPCLFPPNAASSCP